MIHSWQESRANAADDALNAAPSLCQHVDLYGVGLASRWPGFNFRDNHYHSKTFGDCEEPDELLGRRPLECQAFGITEEWCYRLPEQLSTALMDIKGALHPLAGCSWYCHLDMVVTNLCSKFEVLARADQCQCHPNSIAANLVAYYDWAL